MRLSRKLPLAATLLTFISIALASGAALYLGSASMSQLSYEKLSAIADGRRSQIETYLENIRKDLDASASRRDVQSAAAAFAKVYVTVKGDPAQELQARYIENNPNPVGSKHLLDTADVDSYDKIHKRYHLRFREIMEAQDYQDVYLIDLDGNVIYTVSKQADYATNLASGQWKGTDLASMYTQILNAENPGDIVFKDYAKYAPSQGAASSFLGRAILFNGKPVAILAFQMPSSGIEEIMSNKTGLGKTGESLLLNKNGYLITDTSFVDGDNSLETSISSGLLSSVNGRQVETGTLSGYRNMESLVAFASVDFLGAGWVTASLVSLDEAHAGAAAMRESIVLAAIVLSLAALGIAVLFARTITKPIDRVVDSMSKLADGDTEFEMSDAGRTDEIGKMVSAVSAFRDAAIEKRQLEVSTEEQRQAGEQEREEREREKEAANAVVHSTMERLAVALDQLADGDLTALIEEPFEGDLDALRHNFNASLEKLRNAMLSISENTQSINNNAAEMRAAADDLSHRTEEQAASLEESSSALEEITATVKETASQARDVANMAQDAQTDTDTSSKIVGDAVEAMAGIEKSSGEISNIVNLIDEIAFQTNLLALNAGVEAARAGEAGQGFAVVAQEVRELAQRSANAAKEIQALINASSEQVANGVGLVRKTGESLGKISEHVTSINGRIASIAQATGEQLTGVEEISTAVNQMDQATQQNAAMVEESTAVTHKMAEEVRELNALVAMFKTGTAMVAGEADRSIPAEDTKPSVPKPVVNTVPEAKVEAPRKTPMVSGNTALALDTDTDWEEF